MTNINDMVDFADYEITVGEREEVVNDKLPPASGYPEGFVFKLPIWPENCTPFSVRFNEQFKEETIQVEMYQVRDRKWVKL